MPVTFRRGLLAAALLALAALPSWAAVPIRSFSYLSYSCGPNGFMAFGTRASDWKLSPYPSIGAQPGAGSWPTEPIWIFHSSITLLSPDATNWAIIGHSGTNGDWTSDPATPGRGAISRDFPVTHPVYFDPVSDYLDVHVARCSDGTWVILNFEYVPAAAQ